MHKTSNMVTREAVLALAKREAKPVEVDGVGTFLVRPWNNRDKLNFERFAFDAEGKPKDDVDEDARFAKIIQLTVVTDSGELMFSNVDLSTLNELPHQIFRPLLIACLAEYRSMNEIEDDAEKNSGSVSGLEPSIELQTV